MRVKTQLNVTIGLVAVTLVAMAAMSVYEQRELTRLDAGQEAVEEMLRGAGEIALLGSELLFRPSERAKAQWSTRHASLNALLERPRCCEEPRWQALLADVAREHRALGDAVERLLRLDGSQDPTAEAALMRTRLSTVLMTRSRAMTSLLQELSESKRMIRVARLRTMARWSILVDVVAFLACGLLLLLLRRRLLDAISRLARGFRRVADGDLAHRLDWGGRDEFGDLARGFDHMTRRLGDQTARLRESEAGLAEANRALEARVEARTAELDQAVRELYSAGDELARSQRHAVMGRLVARMSHELNNPLMGALNYVQHVRAKVGEPALAHWLMRAEREIDRAIEVMRRVLVLDRGDDERRQPVQLARLVRDAVDLAATALSAAGAVVDNQVPDGLPAVQGQPRLLRQALLNLLTNAAEALDGGPRREIVISACSARDRILLKVDDSGPGVPEALRAKVFDPFMTTKSHSRATGLGLTIARRLVEGGGGELSCEAGPGGARFVMALPPALVDDGQMLSPVPAAGRDQAGRGRAPQAAAGETSAGPGDMPLSNATPEESNT